MAREMPAAVSTAIQGAVVHLALFGEFQFASGTVRMWTGAGDKSWSGQTWTGGGNLVGISPIDETTEVSAAGLNFTLNGVPSSLVGTALADAYRGRPCKLWLAILDAAEAVVDVVQVFAGRMDVMTIADAGETATITLQAENRLVDLRRPRSSRYTNEEQQRLFAGDVGLEFVAKLAEKPLYWGVPAGSAASAPLYSGAAGGDDRTYEQD